MNIITTPLRWILDLIYGFVGNYGVAVILFTLVIKLLLLPLDIKQRNSMRRMQDVQPKLNEINKKYEKDPEKRSQKTMELYKKEKINPMGGCLPMLIQMPVLIAMFSVMRHIAGEEIVQMVQLVQEGGTYVPQSFLWITNIFQPDNIMASVIPTLSEVAGNLTVIKGNEILVENVVETVKANYDVVMKPMMELYNTGSANGWAILPILAGVTQFFSAKLMSAQQNTANNPQAGQQKMMNMLFPIMSVFFCWSYNAAFSLYWVTSNIYTIVTYVLFNVIYDRKAKKGAADKA